MNSLLSMVTIVLVVLWVLGFAMNIGVWIHFLFVLAAIVLVVSLLYGSTNSGGSGGSNSSPRR